MSNVTGLPEDVFINDFAFKNTAGVPNLAQATSMFGRVSDFYRNVGANGRSVGSFISSAVDRAATHLVQVFSITAAGTGSPIFEFDWLGPTAPTELLNLPNEVSGVLSFHALLTGVSEEIGGTRPRARRRGRVYVGPLTVEAIDTADDNPRLDATFLTTLRQQALTLKDQSVTNNHPWQVWSRADQVLRPVLEGWTEDAPDTQRRRGVAASTRTTWGP